jgi:NAD(P) transhydrogenase subunit beta
MLDQLLALGYLVAAAMFIIGIKRLSKVRTAVNGNRLAAVGMALAIVLTLLDIGVVDYKFILLGIVVGSVVGAFAAIRVQMTQMPEFVALFNGFGGAASALVGLSVFYKAIEGRPAMATDLVVAMGGMQTAVSSVLSLIVGAVTFSGSMIAFWKLNGTIRGNHLGFSWINAANIALMTVLLALGAALVVRPWSPLVGGILFLLVGIGSLKLGVTTTLRIGGADMPVVISLLNSLSGVAGSMAGFVVQNNLLIISGSLVGASGLILSAIMCKAMNRTLREVLFRNFGGDTSKKDDAYGTVKEATAEEVAMMMDDVSSVIFVPGYGLAVAQAQHTTRELANLLEKKGVQVRYAIHPVAGRMPGHMNVLLAEADVPYNQLVEMDQINPDFKTTDMVIVLGANDVVNPAAATDKASPIYGMPILNVQEARTVIVVKRSLASGFAGVVNHLFDSENTIMVFGDAKKVLQDLVTEVRQAS